MTIWHEWTQAALLGTQRSAGIDSPTVVNPLYRLLRDLPAANREHHLLSTIAVLSAHETVGQSAAQTAANQLFAPAPAHDRPSCSPRAARYLEMMLSGRYRSQLNHFLHLLGQQEQRVPDQLLPNLLQAGVRSGSLRLALVDVLDEHGRWLAAQNPAWAYLSGDLTDWAQLRTQWDRADNAQRQQLLTQLRHLHPTLGRELLATQWKQLPELVRRWGIKALHTNISMADEPFLEMALDDRDLTVRQQAVQALTYLPQSRLSQRMTAVADDWLHWQHEPPSIRLTFPDEIPVALVRDGVQKAGLSKLPRLRSRQLLQVLGAVPLGYFATKWQQPPRQIIRAAMASIWPRTLTQAWINAAQRQKDVDWAHAILAELGLSTQTGKLLHLLPDDDWRQFVTKIMARHAAETALHKDNPLFHIFRSGQRPWPEALARNWLELLARHIAQDSQSRLPHSTLRIGLQQFGNTCPPALAAEAAKILQRPVEQSPAWKQVVNTFLHTLRFRENMLAALAEPSASRAAV